MPTRDTAPIGAPCWVDLMTSDAARSREFYSQVFGWTAEEPSEEFGGYFMFTRGGVPVAGGMPSRPGEGPTDIWSVYLASEDAEKTLETAAAHGGQVVVGAMPVADLGVMAMAIDPTGAAIGVWQPQTFHGIGVLTEPGAPSWFELHTRDYATAVDFYRDVFGWTTRVAGDTDEFRYTLLTHGEEELAGIMDASGFLPEGASSHWAVYFGTEDADATLAKITSLGGSVIRPAEDTPYGRLATAADPLGTQFKLVAPNEAMPAKS